jgi:hypothetical protein
VDLDPAFFLNADPDLGSQTNARSIQIMIWIMVRLCRHKKMDFDMKNILYVVICHKNTYLDTAGTLKAGKSGSFVNFGQLSFLQNLDPHSQYGSWSRRASRPLESNSNLKFHHFCLFWNHYALSGSGSGLGLWISILLPN